MIGGLGPYPEYRETGLSWLNMLPRDWKLVRAKGVFEAIDVRSESGAEELLTVSASDGVVPRRQKTVTMFMAKSYIGHKLCWPGDLVVNSLWAWMQGLGVARHHGLISSAYSVYRPRPAYSDYSRFFHYLLRSAAYKWELQTRSKGVWLSRLLLSDLSFMDMPVLLPPPGEQAAIVCFLNHANLQLERAIRPKKKLIALLNEQKQAIIHGAVTRGLDPNVRLKPSGVPWLGDIPQHWEVRRLGQISRVFNGTTPSRAQPAFWRNGTVPWLASGKVNDYVVRAASEFLTERALQECSLSLVPRGAVIVGMVGQGKTRGMSARLEIDACINQNLAAIVPNGGLRGDYLHHFLTGHYAPLREFGRGGNQEALNCEIVGRFRIALPPPDEQARLTEYLAAALHEGSRSDQHAKDAIDLIREYRTRLIADIVTGQLDVREAARNLPAEVEEPEAAIEADPEVEAEELLEAVDE